MLLVSLKPTLSCDQNALNLEKFSFGTREKLWKVAF